MRLFYILITPEHIGSQIIIVAVRFIGYLMLFDTSHTPDSSIGRAGDCSWIVVGL